jgi:hypothetical protein
MSNFLTPPTSASLRCERRQPGLLGVGQQGFAGETAMSFYMRPPSIAGQYVTDDYTAAWLLVYQLSSPDEEMSPAEIEASVLLLRELLQKLKEATNISVEALQSLQKAAEDIPIVGSLMFSGGNLPGTIASASGLVMAATKSKKVSDLLDLTKAQSKKLHKWANSRGGPNAQTAGKALKGRIKIIREAGQLYLKIPLTVDARDYKVLGTIGRTAIQIPIDQARSTLNKSVHLHANGASGNLKVMTGSVLGFVLAVGPQAYLDWNSSTSKQDFLRKSAETQPTNLASFVVGAVATAALGAAGAPLIVVLGVGWLAGLGAQAVMAHTGWDKEFKDYLLK